MSNQFDKYYKDLIQFLVENNISIDSDFRGLTISEIANLENSLEHSIPEELKCYLTHFGRRMNLNYLGVSKYTMKNIVNASEIADQQKVKTRILNSKIVDLWSEEPINCKLDGIIVLGYLDTTNYYTLLSRSKTESSLYGWDYGEYTYKFNSTLFGELRSQIYNGLKTICDIRRDQSQLKPNTYSMDIYQGTENINISKIDWLSIYQSRYVSNNLLVASIQSVNEDLFKSESNTKSYSSIEEYGNLVEIELNKRMKNSR